MSIRLRNKRREKRRKRAWEEGMGGFRIGFGFCEIVIILLNQERKGEE